MIDIIQETDTKIIFPILGEIQYKQRYLDETSTETSFGQYSQYNSIIDDALIKVKSHNNKIISSFAVKILIEIQKTITSLCSLKFELCDLPSLNAFFVEDGSILIEWIFSQFRVGFVVDPELNDSSWYLVSNNDMGDINASGFIVTKDLNRLVLWLISFIISSA